MAIFHYQFPTKSYFIAMYLRSYRRKSLSERIIILAVTTVFFIVGFVLNITSNASLYNYNLDVVPYWQENSVLGSHAFLTFMNVVSNVLNPTLCAGYLALFYLITYRKLQILTFLIWFMIVTWLLSILKMAIHQPRPYWIPEGQVQMLEWTCYTEFGCPSGHSMMGIIIFEYFLRFFARVHQCVHKYIGFFYILILIMQITLMFSRVILGMHSLNQVLFGFMIGTYLTVPYYLFIEGFIMRILIRIFNYPKSGVTNIISFTCIIVILAIEVLLALLPNYSSDTIFWNVIETTSGCGSKKFYQSFQWKCLEDTGLAMASFGFILGLSFNSKPYQLAQMLSYSRISLKFLGRFLLTIVITFIPLLIFMNPLWERIDAGTEGQAFVLWATSNVGFFFAAFFLVSVVPWFGSLIGLQQFKHPQSYLEFKQFQVINMLKDPMLTPTIRETELTEPRATDLSKLDK